MDRIELATQLISKGVELLDESAGRNGAAERYREEHSSKSQNEEAADILMEAVNMIDDYESLNEGMDPDTISAIACLGLYAAAMAAMISIPIYAEHKRKVADTKNAKAISVEEYNDAIKYLSSLKGKIEACIKSSKYGKYLKNNEVIHIYNDLPTIDIKKKQFNHKYAFHPYYRLFSINIRELAKANGTLSKINVTTDRINEYIKKEAEDIAKIIDKVKILCYQNKFIKEGFSVYGQWENEARTVFSMILYSEQGFVLNTSKYVKNKK